jgi:hypothetical protein
MVATNRLVALMSGLAIGLFGCTGSPQAGPTPSASESQPTPTGSKSTDGAKESINVSGCWDRLVTYNSEVYELNGSGNRILEYKKAKLGEPLEGVLHPPCRDDIVNGEPTNQEPATPALAWTIEGVSTERAFFVRGPTDSMDIYIRVEREAPQLMGAPLSPDDCGYLVRWKDHGTYLLSVGEELGLPTPKRAESIGLVSAPHCSDVLANEEQKAPVAQAWKLKGFESGSSWILVEMNGDRLVYGRKGLIVVQ